MLRVGLLSSLLALSAFAQEASSDAPVALAVKSGMVQPTGGREPVEVGEGLFMNKTAALTIDSALGDAMKENTKLVDDVNKLKTEVATSWGTPVVVLVAVTSFVVGAVAAGVAVAVVKK